MYKIIFLVLVFLTILTVIGLWIFNPIVPKAWYSISVGMQESDVYKVMREKYDTPVGLEQELSRLKTNNYCYGLGNFRSVCGSNYSMAIEFDNTGEIGGLSRKVVKVEIVKQRKPLFEFVCGLFGLQFN